MKNYVCNSFISRCFTEWKQYVKPERKLAVQIAGKNCISL